MSADILDRLSVELVLANKHGDPDLADILRDAANALADRDAEIVRLRGEVCSCPSGDGSLRWPCKAHPPESIAPAEAKGDAPGKNVHTEHCCREHGCKYGDAECPVEHGRQVQSYPCEDCTPQPADGSAVAVGEVVIFGDDLKEVSWRKGKMPEVGTKLYTHPAGDALGAVRELIDEWRQEVEETRVEEASSPEDYAGFLEEKIDQLEAALQHRGDSRGGEG